MVNARTLVPPLAVNVERLNGDEFLNAFNALTAFFSKPEVASQAAALPGGCSVTRVLHLTSRT